MFMIRWCMAAAANNYTIDSIIPAGTGIADDIESAAAFSSRDLTAAIPLSGEPLGELTE
jgi:hypothetical protein